MPDYPYTITIEAPGGRMAAAVSAEAAQDLLLQLCTHLVASGPAAPKVAPVAPHPPQAQEAPVSPPTSPTAAETQAVLGWGGKPLRADRVNPHGYMTRKALAYFRQVLPGNPEDAMTVQQAHTLYASAHKGRDGKKVPSPSFVANALQALLVLGEVERRKLGNGYAYWLPAKAASAPQPEPTQPPLQAGSWPAATVVAGMGLTAGSLQ
jgi:hypothetical protein